MIEGVVFYVLAALVGILVALVLARRGPVIVGAQARRGSDKAPPLPENHSPTPWWTDMWEGSFYELIVHLGPRDEGRLVAAIQTLWSTGPLIGPTPSPDGKPPPPLTVSPRQSGDIRFYGRLRLSSSPAIECCLITVCGEAVDDLTLYVPRATLDTHFGPEPAAAAGTREIQSAFLSVADRLFARVPFKLGAIGEEVLTSFPSRSVVPGYDFDVEFEDYLAAAETGLGTITGSEALDRQGASGGVLVSPDLKDRVVPANLAVTVLPSGLLWLTRREV